MADVVEVIKGLRDIQKHLDTGYSYAICWNSELIRDALELLKEKEAVKPRNTYSTTLSGKVIPHIFCGKCNKEIFAIYEFCPFCGRAVKWK